MSAGWRRWGALPARDRRLFAGLLALLPLVAAAIRLFGLAQVQRTMIRWTPDRPAAAGRDVDARALARLVDAAARRAPGRPSCLPRSLTLWWLLRRRGTDSTLRIGVRTVAGRLEAHAWVDHAGQPVNDTADVAERFPPFEGMPLPASWIRP
jgi:hypothetical protein